MDHGPWGNPFLEISVPEASIKLVQAVGRLIRTERDYGRVSILDNRLLKQAYGRQLLAALPHLDESKHHHFAVEYDLRSPLPCGASMLNNKAFLAS